MKGLEDRLGPSLLQMMLVSLVLLHLLLVVSLIWYKTYMGRKVKKYHDFLLEAQQREHVTQFELYRRQASYSAAEERVRLAERVCREETTFQKRIADRYDQLYRHRQCIARKLENLRKVMKAQPQISEIKPSLYALSAAVEFIENLAIEQCKKQDDEARAKIKRKEDLIVTQDTQESLSGSGGSISGASNCTNSSDLSVEVGQSNGQLVDSQKRIAAMYDDAMKYLDRAADYFDVNQEPTQERKLREELDSIITQFPQESLSGSGGSISDGSVATSESQ